MKKLLILAVLAAIANSTNAEKIITIRVCGSSTGYWVSEQHDDENDIHSLTCTIGEDNPCKWVSNPSPGPSKMFHNPIPNNSIFKDQNGNTIAVDLLAANNAVNNSISNGTLNTTIIVNNLTIHYQIVNSNSSPDTNQLTLLAWVN